MLWQGAKWRILKKFNVQNEECHHYGAMAIPKIFTTFQTNQWLHDKAFNCDSKNVQWK